MARTRNETTMQIFAWIEKVPGDLSGTSTEPAREIEAHGEDYELARSAVLALVPEGWRALNVRPVRIEAS